jgi:two-component system, NtrC family, sensor kinase
MLFSLLTGVNAGWSAAGERRGRSVGTIKRMQIGTRLTVVLLLLVTPVVAGYTWWSINSSSRLYSQDVRRESRAFTLGLAPIIESYLKDGKRQELEALFKHLRETGNVSALLRADRTPWYGSPELPSGLLPRALQTIDAGKRTFEFIGTNGRRQHWYCRIAPINFETTTGYLVMAQDWTGVIEDGRERWLISVGAALVVIALLTSIIPIAVHRYVSQPMSALSRNISRSSIDDEPRGDEVTIISKEFRRLDQQVSHLRMDLLQRLKREIELERRLQRADRLSAIGTLASGLAHEIGTPLGVIRARAEFIQQGGANTDRMHEGLAIILKQIDRVSRIVRMLVDYARVRESRRATQDVRPIIAHVLSLIETETMRRNVELVANLGDRPLMAKCDADQLEQVFLNLAINAFDAMAPDGGNLTVTATMVAEEAQVPEIRIVFDDTGSGILPEHRDRIFNPFFTTKEIGKGTGMGLSISHSIMRDHGGDLAFESHADGASFLVAIPADITVVAVDEGVARSAEMT